MVSRISADANGPAHAQAGEGLIRIDMLAGDEDAQRLQQTHPGDYVVFLPGELHRPCLAINEKMKIRKAVIKIHRDLLAL